MTYKTSKPNSNGTLLLPVMAMPPFIYTNGQSNIQLSILNFQKDMMLNLLPREILFEILSLLPVKFLPRVKCLCKALLCLILDPIFANVLASRGPKILISSSSGLKSLDCSKASFTFQRALTNLNFPPSYDKIINFSSIEIEGSCNGLVVVALKINDKKKITGNYFYGTHLLGSIRNYLI